MKKVRWLAAALLLFAFIGAACGGDDDDDSASGGSTTTEADSGDDAAAPPEYTITASDEGGAYKFDVPDDIAGGVVTITLDNKGGKEVHDFQLAKLNGHKAEELTADEETPLEDWLTRAAGVGGVGPGQSATATFELEPNTEYAFFCTQSNEETHESHGAHGMRGSFTTGDDSGAELPEADATIETSEYKFDIDGLKAGKNTVAFSNKGAMLHHVLIAPIAEGKTLDDVKAAFASEGEPSGPPPVDFEKLNASAVAGPGDTIVYDLDLEPGHYVVICFMPDKGTADPPHLAKGMIDEFTIS